MKISYLTPWLAALLTVFVFGVGAQAQSAKDDFEVQLVKVMVASTLQAAKQIKADAHCSKLRDPLPCYATIVRNAGGDVDATIGDFQAKLLGNSALGKSYQGINPKAVKDGTWNSFWPDTIAFLKKSGVRNPDEIQTKYPDLYNVLRSVVRKEGAKTAFQAAGYDVPGENHKNFCYSGPRSSSFLPESARLPLVQRTLATELEPAELPSIKKLTCDVSCGFGSDERFGCYPNGDHGINYGTPTFTDATVGCYDVHKHCDTGANAGALGAGTVPMPGKPFDDAYHLTEGEFTERTEKFAATQMVANYARLTQVNATSSQELTSSIRALEAKIGGCKATPFTPLLRQLLRDSLKKAEERSTAESAREVYAGQVAQGAECVERLAQRLDKLQYLLYDSESDYRVVHVDMNNGTLGRVGRAFLDPGGVLHNRIHSPLMGTPKLGRDERFGTFKSTGLEVRKPIEVDGDKLYPICGGFSKTVYSRPGEKPPVVSLDGAKIKTEELNRSCQALKVEETRIQDQLVGIRSQFPVLFERSGSSSSVVSELLAKLPAEARNPGVSGYGRGAKVFSNDVGSRPDACLSGALKAPLGDAQIEAGRQTLNAHTKPLLDKLGTGVEQMACKPVPAGFYRDMVVENEALMAMYLTCADKKAAFGVTQVDDPSCKDRAHDAWMGCVRHRTRQATPTDKMASALGAYLVSSP